MGEFPLSKLESGCVLAEIKGQKLQRCAVTAPIPSPSPRNRIRFPVLPESGVRGPSVNFSCCCGARNLFLVRLSAGWLAGWLAQSCVQPAYFISALWPVRHLHNLLGFPPVPARTPLWLRERGEWVPWKSTFGPATNRKVVQRSSHFSN